MAQKKREEQVFECPVGKFFIDLDKIFGKKSEFTKHMAQSRIEFLKGIRALVDERIENLEKQHSARRQKKRTKIKVE
jgi:hypothetical protein